MRSVLVLTALATAAHADTIVTQPLALLGRGVSLGYEHQDGRFSVVGLAGARAAALGDYSSTTLTAGAELRYWPWRHLYIAFHASAGRTHVVDEILDRSAGSSVELAERVEVGWRFHPWRRLTLAPTLGAGAVEDVGQMPVYAAPTATIGFELGYRL